MKTINLITDSILSKKTLSDAAFKSWVKEYADETVQPLTADSTKPDALKTALQARLQTDKQIAANLKEGITHVKTSSTASLIKSKESDLLLTADTVVRSHTANSIALAMEASHKLDDALAEKTLKAAFDFHAAAVNGVKTIPVPQSLFIYQAKFDSDKGTPADTVLKNLDGALKLYPKDRCLTIAYSHYAVSAGKNSLASKKLSALPVNKNNFQEMVLRKRLDPNGDFGRDPFPDFPGTDGPSVPGFECTGFTLPGRGNGGIITLPPDPIEPERPFDELPEIRDNLMEVDSVRNIRNSLTDGVSSKFPENFYTYHYELLDSNRIAGLTEYINGRSGDGKNELFIINVIKELHKDWNAALGHLHRQKFDAALVALSSAQKNALALLRTVRGELAKPLVDTTRITQPGVFSDEERLKFDQKAILQFFFRTVSGARNEPARAVVNRENSNRKNLASLDELYDFDWRKPVVEYAPNKRPLLYRKPVESAFLTDWSGYDHNDFVTQSDVIQNIVEKRVAYFDFHFLRMAFLFIPFARIEAYRFSRQFENALNELDWLNTLDAEFGFLNVNIEKPFVKILESQICLEMADKHYKTAESHAALISVLNPKGLVAAETYAKAINVFKEYPRYQQQVEAAVVDFSAPANLNDTLIKARRISLPGVSAFEPGKLGLAPGVAYPWQKKLAITLTNDDGYCTNPLIYALIMQAKSKLLQISANFNYLGYADEFIPPWKFSFLLDRSRYYTDQTKNLQRDYLNFISNAEREEFQEMSAGQSVSMERMNVTMENARVELSVRERDVATTTSELAELQAENAKERKENFDAYDKTADIADTVTMVAGILGGASDVTIGAMAISAGNPVDGIARIVGGVSSAVGTGSALAKEGAQRDMEQKNLALAVGEAAKSGEVAEKQKAVARQSLTIANLQAQASLMRLEFAQDNYEYLRNRLTSAELWFRLAHQIREIADIYFRRSVEMAFLAEQAYEFMVDRRLNVIRFDYDNDELGAMLGADYLKADLDYLESHLLATRREKQQKVRCVISLARDFPQALQDLRENETSIVPITLEYLEKRFPGLYQVKVAALEVQPLAIMDPTRFNLEVAFLGSGIVRTQNDPVNTDGSGEQLANNFDHYGAARNADGFMKAVGANGNSLLLNDQGKVVNAQGTVVNPQPQGPFTIESRWILDAEADFPVKTLLHALETSLFTGLTAGGQDGIFTEFAGQQKAAFEECPAAAGWRISMNSAENGLVPGSLADVELSFYLTGFFDEELKTAMAEAMRSTEQLVTSVFTARSDFSDEGYNFQRTGRLSLTVRPEMLSLTQRVGALKELSFRFLPAPVETFFSRYSSVSIGEYTFDASGLKAVSSTPKMIIEGSGLSLEITLTDRSSKSEITIFTEENPSLVLTAPVTSGRQVFKPVEFKQQGRQVIVLREISNGQLRDYPIEVFVSKNEKPIVPLTVFTTVKASGTKLTFQHRVLGRTSTTITESDTANENVQLMIVSSEGKLLGSSADPKFMLTLAAAGTSVRFTVLAVYTRKLNVAFNCTQDNAVNIFPVEGNTLRTNASAASRALQPEIPTAFSAHLFGAPLTSKVKSPLGTWNLELSVAKNAFIDVFDCNGSRKTDLSMFRDVVLTTEYKLHPNR